MTTGTGLCLADEAAAAGGPLHVRPKTEGILASFLADPVLPFDLTDAFGSPLNVVFPGRLPENLRRFRETCEARGVKPEIYFTSKPNRSAALMREAAAGGWSVDVSSERELSAALANGFPASRIEATGPKSSSYLDLAAAHGVTVNADSLDELAALVASTGRPGPVVPLLVRMEGFGEGRAAFTPQESQFGVRISEAGEVWELLGRAGPRLRFRGFAVHFNAGDFDRRPPAVAELLALTFEAVRRGHSPDALDVGGGYRIDYAADAEEWYRFVAALKSSVLGARSPLVWNDGGLGFRKEGGVVRGAPTFMEHTHPASGAADLAKVIDARLPSFGNRPIHEVLSDNLLSLLIEPGRAALDQCGLTLAAAAFHKRTALGEFAVGLEMNRTNLNTTQLPLMTDPVILRRGPPGPPVPDGLFYTGNLCLTHDVIQYRRSYPGSAPARGDLVAWVNTAAYQMDFTETEVLRQRTAAKVAVAERSGRLRFFADDVYRPIRPGEGRS